MTTLPLSPLRILVVDDNPDILKVYRLALQDSDTEVLTASSGAMALEKAISEHLHLIIVDVQMPEMDGFELCRRLKEDARSSPVPILFATGNTTIEDELRALQLGAVDYLHKPFSLVILRGAVQRWALPRDEGSSPAKDGPHRSRASLGKACLSKGRISPQCQKQN